MEHAIIEFKARCSDHARIRAILESKHAQFVGEDHQIDTYFRVSRGRLKLREGDIENALVFYDRPNQAGPKQSDVALAKLPLQSDVVEVLTRALGVMTVVNKRREIYFVDNVKVHLDRVDALGEFVEVEAIGEANEVNKLWAQCKVFQNDFGVKPEDLVEGSYSDLLLGQ